MSLDDYEIALKKLPMPPTINKSLMVARGRMIHTKESRIFKKQIEDIEFYNFHEITKTRKYFSDHRGERFIKIHVHYFFRADELYYKNGKLKKMDCHNRSKAIYDGVSTLVGVDDRYFVPGSYQLSPTNELSYVDVYLSIYQ